MISFPEKNESPEKIMLRIDTMSSEDAAWENGKVFGFIYKPPREAAEFIEEVFGRYFYHSTLNPFTFPSICRMENEIVGMVAQLLHGERHTVGNITTGGTESILMAIKIARDKGLKEKKIYQPEIILPKTAHPAFDKASQLLQVKPVYIALDREYRADTQEVERRINQNTVMIVGSAPCFPYGVIDDIPTLGSIAKKYDILFHVDACMGGMMLPFLDMDYPVPDFDFRVKGVSSISVDPHKFGYGPKACSILLLRHRRLRRYQFFIKSDWPGGIFASTSVSGTRGGGPVAGTWAMLRYAGKQAYHEITSRVMSAREKLLLFIDENQDQLQLIGKPAMGVLAITSKELDIHAMGDLLDEKGWKLDRLQNPAALHLTISETNYATMDQFISDLRIVLQKLKEKDVKHILESRKIRSLSGVLDLLPSSLIKHLIRKHGKGDDDTSTLYGLSGSIKKRKNMDVLVFNILDKTYSLDS
jgi:glutamate/tyrosine decarboxylase-like PLP-dependent enzyme